MHVLAVVAVLLGAAPGIAAPKLGRLSLVVDPALAREHLRHHGVRFDDVFTVRRPEAEQVRAAIVPYLRANIHESPEAERPYVRAILAGISFYRWHCAGLVYQKTRRLFCVALTPAVDRDVLHHQQDADRGLPVVFDGGIAILNILFDFDKRAVETFFWNSEA